MGITPKPQLERMIPRRKGLIMKKSDIELQLRDYRLTTAEILYHLPDYPKLLQSFIWQQMDLAPKFPSLKKFLGFWEDEIDADIHSVHVSHAEIIAPVEMRVLSNLGRIQ
jgi:uncharacterized protein Usg